MPSNSTLGATLSQHLEHDEVLSPLVAKAERLRQLDTALRGSLPPELRPLCSVANLRQRTAVVRVSSSAAAAKVKLLAPRMLAALQRLDGTLEAIKVDVLLAGNGATPRTRRVLEPPRAEVLERLADRLPDSPLREAIRSLAAKGR